MTTWHESVLLSSVTLSTFIRKRYTCVLFVGAFPKWYCAVIPQFITLRDQIKRFFTHLSIAVVRIYKEIFLNKCNKEEFLDFRGFLMHSPFLSPDFLSFRYFLYFSLFRATAELLKHHIIYYFSLIACCVLVPYWLRLFEINRLVTQWWAFSIVVVFCSANSEIGNFQSSGVHANPCNINQVSTNNNHEEQRQRTYHWHKTSDDIVKLSHQK